jgi:hypothetical protein
MSPARPFDAKRPLAVISGAVGAAAMGLACGVALKPTPAESGLPRQPQLLVLDEAQLATFERSPYRLWWPSVPRAWRI